MGHLDGGLAGQPPRQQAVLEGQRGGAFPGEAAGVVDADRGPAGEFLGEDGVVVGVVVHLLDAHGHGDAESGAAGPQRYRHHRMDALAVGASLRGARVALGDPPHEGRLPRLAEDRAALPHRPGDG